MGLKEGGLELVARTYSEAEKSKILEAARRHGAEHIKQYVPVLIDFNLELILVEKENGLHISVKPKQPLSPAQDFERTQYENYLNRWYRDCGSQLL